MADFQVTNADGFLKLSKALKEAGRGDMRKALNKGIRDAAKPIVKETRAEALSILPRSGGLANQVAKEPQRIQVRTGARTAGVRVLVGKKRGGARQTNRGTVRHPVFGNRNVWVEQKVQPDWFDGPARKSETKMRDAVLGAMDDVIDEIVRDAK